MSRSENEAELRDQLVTLTKTEGWKRFHGMLQEQMQSRRVLAMQGCTSQDAILRNEFLKGEYAGLLLAASWVDKALASHNSAIEALGKKEGRDEKSK